MNLSRARTAIQALTAFLSNSYVGVFSTRYVNTDVLKGVCVPYLNCYACPSALFACPIGTLQHFMAIQAMPYLLLGMLGLVGVLVGRMACGWACPFGFLQELLHKLPTPKLLVPFGFRYLKYAVLLILAIMLPYLTGEAWFSKFCPVGSLSAGLPWALWNPSNPATGAPVLPTAPGWPFVLGLLVLVGVLSWSVLARRPFCKALCPLGAIFALFNRASMLRLEVAKGCDSCHVCATSCPMDLIVPIEINSAECIRCLECTRCGHVVVSPPFGGRELLKPKREASADV